VPTGSNTNGLGDVDRASKVDQTKHATEAARSGG